MVLAAGLGLELLAGLGLAELTSTLVAALRVRSEKVAGWFGCFVWGLARLSLINERI